MVWPWITGGILCFFMIRFLWRVYTHPTCVLVRQAANMNWVAIGTVKDMDGGRNTRLYRDGAEAVVTYKNTRVILLQAWQPPKVFKDFIEVERWLAGHETGSPASRAFSFSVERSLMDRNAILEEILMDEGGREKDEADLSRDKNSLDNSRSNDSSGKEAPPP